ncbi:integrase [Streptomyces chrestomyceticus]|uniref:integrase n=1 Tax=Streptomyces chrestomyceticus TaxID=68185 RepID=UPI0033C8714B
MPYIEWRGGKCRVKWWAGEYLPNGRKKYESASGFEDEGAAWNYGLDREYEVRHGTAIKQRDSKTLMSVYCWDWFHAQDLRPSSTRSYKAIINKRIEPYWGSRAVGDITTFEYEAWKKALRAAAERGEISAGYVNIILMVFGAMMDDSVTRYRLRMTSPIVREKRGRGKYKKKVREKKRPQEMATLHRLAVNAYSVWGYDGWTYIWTAAFTGMRPKEMWGLQRCFTSPNWPASDPLDSDDRKREPDLERYMRMPALRVQFQHQWVEGERTLVDPKYESWRTLVVPPFLHEMHKALLASHDSQWMFRSHSGGPLLGTNFEDAYWYPIRDGSPAREGRYARAEIPAVPEMAKKRIYLLRHGHKEWLDEDGHPRVAVEARMGHELGGVEGVYANVTPGMELRIAETLQERWEKFMGEEGNVWLPPAPNPFPVDLVNRVPVQVNGCTSLVVD